MALDLRLPPVSSAASHARHATEAWLTTVGVTGTKATDAVLVVSELVTNGVVHDGGSDIVVWADRTPSAVELEVVSIPGPDGPRDRLLPSGETGRSIAIVGAVCQCVTVEQDASGCHHVTCSLKVPPERLPNPRGRDRRKGLAKAAAICLLLAASLTAVLIAQRVFERHPAQFTRVVETRSARFDAWLLEPLPLRDAQAPAEVASLRQTGSFVFGTSVFDTSYDQVSCGRAWYVLAADVATSPQWTAADRVARLAKVQADAAAVRSWDATFERDMRWTNSA
jgi:anti-sigma regulatory factor (Ser/Thr protein kinase)